MTISFSTSIPKENRKFMKSLITIISPDTYSIVMSKDPLRNIFVTRNWHYSTTIDSDKHFNIRYPPDHLMGGRDIHVHVRYITDDYNQTYAYPFIT